MTLYVVMSLLVGGQLVIGCQLVKIDECRDGSVAEALCLYVFPQHVTKRMDT